MAPKTIRMAIKNCLKNLSEKDLEEFKDALIADKGIPTSSVEGENYLGVTKVMDTTFGEAEALKVVVELLTENGCKKKADVLLEDVKEITSEAGSSQSAGASAGTDRVTPKADGEHFVDRHEVQLIQRVNNISQILDELLAKKVINRETYNTIRGLQPSQQQMRELYKFLNTPDCKDIFYKILEKMEKFLIDDLKKNE